MINYAQLFEEELQKVGFTMNDTSVPWCNPRESFTHLFFQSTSKKKVLDSGTTVHTQAMLNFTMQGGSVCLCTV